MNLLNELFEPPAVHLEMIKGVGMNIGLTQLKPGFLEVVEKRVDTSENIMEILKDFLRRFFSVMEDGGNAIGA